MKPVALLVVSLIAVHLQHCHGEIVERIFNGAPAVRGQFPYQALLFSQNKTGPPNSYFKCGGSLISTRYVLTAAHCTYKYYKTVIFLGVISDADLTPPGYFQDEVMVSSNVFPHPRYNHEHSFNDINIIKLSKEATLSEFIQTIGLPNYSWRAIDHYKDKRVMVSGFGMKYEGDKGPSTLDYTPQIIMGQDECKSYYKDVQESMLCTEKKIIYAGPCKGDSGGPLTLTENNKTYLIGAVSYGLLNGCNKQYPETYANVAWYLPYIRRTTGLQYVN